MASDQFTSNSSNNQIVLFSFEGNRVRTLQDANGEVWFVAADVCKVLDIINVSQAVNRLDADEKGICSNDTLGGTQQVAIVNEPGLYSLVMGSRKPEAKSFKRWIAHEVIPAIRKTGGYSISRTGDHILDALEEIKQSRMAQLALEKQQAETERRVEALAARVDSLSADDGYFTVAGYFALRRQNAPREVMAQVGKRCVSLSHSLNVPIGTLTHPNYGKVNTYDQNVLKQVLGW